jgi:hypothetical protein
MATLDPTARPSHRPGYVQIDVPTPECTLSTVAPIGAHLVIQATIAQGNGYSYPQRTTTGPLPAIGHSTVMTHAGTCGNKTGLC